MKKKKENAKRCFLNMGKNSLEETILKKGKGNIC